MTGFSRLILAVGLLALAAISASASLGAPGTDRAGVVTIGYADPLGSEEGLRGVGWGERQAIKQLPLNWKVAELDDKLSADKQVSDIDSMIAQHVGGMTSWTLDPGAADAVYKRARAANIPVIGMNSTSKYFNSSIQGWTDATCLVSNEQAQFIAQKIPHAKIFALGGPPVPSITLTTNCFLAAAKKAGLECSPFRRPSRARKPRVNRSPRASCSSTLTCRRSGASPKAFRSAFPRPLKASGKTIWSGNRQGIIVIARNGTSAAAEAIRTGNMTATWDNNQPLVGAAAIQVLKYLLVDEVPTCTAADKDLHPFEAVGSGQHRLVQEPGVASRSLAAADQVRRSESMVRETEASVRLALAAGRRGLRATWGQEPG